MEAKEIETLDDIKRLLILLLIKVGSSSEELGAALKVHPSRVRQLVPSKKVTKINFAGSGSG